MPDSPERPAKRRRIGTSKAASPISTVGLTNAPPGLDVEAISTQNFYTSHNSYVPVQEIRFDPSATEVTVSESGPSDSHAGKPTPLCFSTPFEGRLASCEVERIEHPRQR